MAGFFGKLPSKGDFVSRDLPRDFYEPIDDWFRAGMQESKASLGDDWFPHYQVMPIWHFYIGEEVLGKNAWIGVWIPSADRVNRSFPFLMACPVEAGEAKSLGAFLCFQDWFVHASDLLLQGLEETQEFDDLCAAFEELEPYASDAAPFCGLEQQSTPVAASTQGSDLEAILSEVKLSGKLEMLIRHFDSRLANIESRLSVDSTPAQAGSDAITPDVASNDVPIDGFGVAEPGYVGEDAIGKNLYFFRGLQAPDKMLVRPDQCIWQSEGSDEIDPQIVVTNGLPQTEEFVNFLTGFDPFD